MCGYSGKAYQIKVSIKDCRPGIYLKEVSIPSDHFSGLRHSAPFAKHLDHGIGKYFSGGGLGISSPASQPLKENE